MFVEKGYYSDSEMLKINVSKRDQDIGFKDFDFIKPLG